MPLNVALKSPGRVRTVEHGWHCLQAEEDDPSGDAHSVREIAADRYHFLRMAMAGSFLSSLPDDRTRHSVTIRFGFVQRAAGSLGSCKIGKIEKPLSVGLYRLFDAFCRLNVR